MGNSTRVKRDFKALEQRRLFAVRLSVDARSCRADCFWLFGGAIRILPNDRTPESSSALDTTEDFN